MLDVECSVRGFPDTYVQKVKVQHKDNRKLFEPKHCDLNRTFGIHHYAGQVVYDTSDFLDTNRDVIADDLVSIFVRENCQFGFATHLFGNEIKALHATNVASGFVGSPPCPRGASFRISPTSTSHPDHQLLNGDEPVSTLTQDFHTRLDNLLRTLVHAKPHFVRCIRPNEHESLTEFDRMHVTQQVRSLQILETVNLMAYGFPHRMRFKAFNSRYRMLAKPAKSLSRLEEKAVDDCEIILDCYSRALREAQNDKGSLLHQGSTESMTSNNKDWAHGRKHIFLSEGARQQLEQMRDSRRKWAATKVQSLWRGWNVRKKRDSKPKRNDDIHNSNQFNPLKASTKTTISAMMHHSNEINHASQMIQNKNMMSSSTGAINGLPLIPGGIQQFQNSQLVRSQRPRPQPISGTPPPESSINNHPVDRCDFKTIQQTCSLFGLDLVRWSFVIKLCS
jgi:dachs protein